jgi:hypothetical protein
MNPPAQQVIERYRAIDAHEHYVVVGSLNAQTESVLPRAWRTGKPTKRPGLSGVEEWLSSS